MNKLLEKAKEAARQKDVEKMSLFKDLLKNTFGDDCLEYIEIIDHKTIQFLDSRFGLEMIDYKSEENNSSINGLYLKDFAKKFDYDKFGPIIDLDSLHRNISEYEYSEKIIIERVRLDKEWKERREKDEKNKSWISKILC